MIEPIIAVLAFIPAMIANSLAVLFGGGLPIDFGKRWNGKRILGDGKTWRGLFGGGISAGLLAILIHYLSSPYFTIYPSFPKGPVVIFTLSFGALFGDIGASFIKRRRGISRGGNSPVMDKYDFIVGAFLLIFLIDTEWFYETYFADGGWIGTIIIIVGVPFLHRAVNILGYKLGLEDEPW
ncbi:MAG: CDP-2,3-bis-(O-geranylgeranyl)-sn-glycerol synthase [Candidatus Thermoplasmatota archaeon]